MKKFLTALFLVLLFAGSLFSANAPIVVPTYWGLIIDTVGNVHGFIKAGAGDSLDVYFVGDSVSTGQGKLFFHAGFLKYLKAAGDTVVLQNQSAGSDDSVKWIINADTTASFYIDNDTLRMYSDANYLRLAGASGVYTVVVADTIGQPALSGRITIEGMLTLSFNGANYDIDTTVTPSSGNALIYDGTKFALSTPSGSGWNWADSAGEPPFWVDSATHATHATAADSALIAASAYAADSAFKATGADSALSAVAADSALIAASAYVADSAAQAAHAYAADSAFKATGADSALAAVTADSAAQAAHAYASDSALIAASAYVADSAVEAAHAYVADSALIAAGAYGADSALIAVTADSSDQAAHAYASDSALIAATAYLADSAAKYDTNYAPLLTFVTNHGGSGETDTTGIAGVPNGTTGFGMVTDSLGTRKTIRQIISSTNITVQYSGDTAITIAGSGGSGDDYGINFNGTAFPDSLWIKAGQNAVLTVDNDTGYIAMVDTVSFSDSTALAQDARTADSALIAASAYAADSAFKATGADSALSAVGADSALTAVSADSALIAASAYVADSASKVDTTGVVWNEATHAAVADSANKVDTTGVVWNEASHAVAADSAFKATGADSALSAVAADSALIAASAYVADSASKVDTTGVVWNEASHALVADSASKVDTTGVVWNEAAHATAADSATNIDTTAGGFTTYVANHAGSGETNTSSTSGPTFQITEPKATFDLPFKSFTGAGTVTLDTGTANVLTITGSAHTVLNDTLLGTGEAAAIYETITNVALIGDDTTSWKAAADSVTAWDNGILLWANGTVPLTANWPAGDFDVTGLEKVTADSVVTVGATNTGFLGTSSLRWGGAYSRLFAGDTVRPPTTNTGVVGTAALRYARVNTRSIAGDSLVGLSVIAPFADLSGSVGTGSLRFANFYMVQGFFGANANTGYVRMPFGSNPNTSTAGAGGFGVDTNNYGIEINTNDPGSNTVWFKSVAEHFTVVIPDSGVMLRDTIIVKHWDSTFYPGTITVMKLRMYSKVATTDTVFVGYRAGTPTGTATLIDTLGLSSASNYVSVSFGSATIPRGGYFFIIPLAKTPGTGYTIEFYGRAFEGT